MEKHFFLSAANRTPGVAGGGGTLLRSSAGGGRLRALCRGRQTPRRAGPWPHQPPLPASAPAKAGLSPPPTSQSSSAVISPRRSSPSPLSSRPNPIKTHLPLTPGYTPTSHLGSTLALNRKHHPAERGCATLHGDDDPNKETRGRVQAFLPIEPRQPRADGLPLPFRSACFLLPSLVRLLWLGLAAPTVAQLSSSCPSLVTVTVNVLLIWVC